MALILSLETSEQICSVALSNEYELLGCLEITDSKSHSSMLTVLIDKLFAEKNIAMSSLSAVAISMGPGSYTGLRIGVSVAKGICYALNIPLIAINTLQLLTVGLLQNENFRKLNLNKSELLFCPMIDARRMEVYRAIFNSNLENIGNIEAEILNDLSFINILEKNKVVFFGSGSEKFREITSHENAFFVDDIRLHASYMVSPAFDYFTKQNFEDCAYFEPFYLKDFVAIVAKKKILSF